MNNEIDMNDESRIEFLRERGMRMSTTTISKQQPSDSFDDNNDDDDYEDSLSQ